MTVHGHVHGVHHYVHHMDRGLTPLAVLSPHTLISTIAKTNLLMTLRTYTRNTIVISRSSAYTGEIAPTLWQRSLQLVIVHTQQLHLQQHIVMLQHTTARQGDCIAVHICLKARVVRLACVMLLQDVGRVPVKLFNFTGTHRSQMPAPVNGADIEVHQLQHSQTA